MKQTAIKLLVCLLGYCTLFCSGNLAAQDSKDATRPASIVPALANSSSNSGSNATRSPASNINEVTIYEEFSDEIWGPQTTYTTTVYARRFFGTEEQREKQVQLGLLPKTVRLEFAFQDCDRWFEDDDIPPELDAIYFNGYFLGYLEGNNQEYNVCEFDIPITYINFPEVPGDKGSNELKLIVDTLSHEPNWVLYPQWLKVTIPAPRPIYLVHGWTDDFYAVESMQRQINYSLGIPSVLALVEKDLSPEDNAAIMDSELEELIEQFGVKKFNLLVHSKGGLDSRVLTDTKNGLGNTAVAHVLQVATPNGGSKLADIWGPITGVGNFLNIFNNYSWTTPALESLKPENCLKFNERYRSPTAPIRTIIGTMRNYLPFDDHDDDNDGSDFDDFWSYFFSGYASYKHNYYSADTSRHGDGIVSVPSAHAIGTHIAMSPVHDPGDQTVAHDTIMTTGAPNVIRAFHSQLTEIVMADGNTTKPADLHRSRDSEEEETTVVIAPVEQVDYSEYADVDDGYTSEEELEELPLEAKYTRQMIQIKAKKVNESQFCLFTDTRTDIILIGLPQSTPATLVAPDGTSIAIQPNTIPAMREFALPTSIARHVTLDKPQVGVYTLKVDATALEYNLAISLTAMADPSGLVLHAWQENPREGNEEFAFYATESPVKFYAYTDYLGTIPTDVKMTLTYQLKSDDTTQLPQTIVMLDDGKLNDEVAGDGLFSAQVELPEGAYKFMVAMEGTFNGLPATRSQNFRVSVMEIGETLDTNFTESTKDTNSNELYDQLNLTFPVTAAKAMKGSLSAKLTTNSGELIQTAAKPFTINAGTSNITLTFEGKNIYETGTNGELYVRDITLYKDDSNNFPVVVWSSNSQAYPTKAYKYMDFEHSPFILTGNGSDRLIYDDADSDKATALEISLDVLCRPKSSQYTVLATLYDSSSNNVAYIRHDDIKFSTIAESDSPQPLVLRVPASTISYAGLNGPYVLKQVSLVCRPNNTGRETIFQSLITYRTHNYSLNDFASLGRMSEARYLSYDFTNVVKTGTNLYTATLKITPSYNMPYSYLKGKYYVVRPEHAESDYSIVGGKVYSTSQLQMLDVTKAVEQQLKNTGNFDDKWEAGETVTIQVQYEGGAIVNAWLMNFYYALENGLADNSYFQKPATYYHLDKNLDLALSDQETKDGFNSWKQGNLTHNGLLEAIMLNKYPNYSYDESSRTFKPAQ